MSSDVVASPDLAIAWAKAVAALTQPGVEEISPLIANISGFDESFPPEAATIRQEVDQALEAAVSTKATLCSAETTANTIFPESLWLRYRAEGRAVFFAKYRELMSRLKKRDRRNHKGTYFSRMIDYGAESQDQMSHILDAWDSGTHRRSALQIVIFEPKGDHSRQPFLGFPCLDYLTFTPDTKAKTLSVTALYAEQYLFDRGYGNYLGLCRLGRFVAQQMQLRFSQLTCIASCAKLGEAIGKRDAKALVAKIKPLLSEHPT